MATQDDLDNVLQSALGRGFGVSCDFSQPIAWLGHTKTPARGSVHVVVTMRWWSLFSWQMRKGAVYAVLRAYAERLNLEWTLTKKVKL